jgi:uncharacterized protein YbcI
MKEKEKMRMDDGAPEDAERAREGLGPLGEHAMLDWLGCPGGAVSNQAAKLNGFGAGYDKIEARTDGSAAVSGREIRVPLATSLRRSRISLEHPGTSDSAPRGAVVSQLSREIVQLHARLYGRGPTKARSYIHADYAVCILEEIFTTAERTLIDAGSREHVMETRAKFQDAVSEQFIEIVEGATGRKVRVFSSQVDIDANMAVEFFVFQEEDKER